jgi:TonB family protein
VELEVQPDGKAHNLQIMRSLDPGLDQSALDAISHWRFQPGTKNGLPATVRATIEINFRLL